MIFRNFDLWPQVRQDSNLSEILKKVRPLILVFTRFSENFTTGLEFKVTRIYTCQRFLIDASMVSIWNSNIPSFTNFHLVENDTQLKTLFEDKQSGVCLRSQTDLTICLYGYNALFNKYTRFKHGSNK